MRIIKPLTLSLLTRPYTLRRKHRLGVAVMAMASLDDAHDLMMEADLWRIAGEFLDEDGVLDLGIPKPCAEFLVSGRAYDHGPKRSGQCAVRVSVAGLEKTLRVSGDRHWLAAGGASAPTPVDGVSLDWRHTFGGPNFSENPLGRGAVRESDGRWPLPNVEPLSQRLVREGQPGMPVSFGPVSPTRPRRFRRAGGYEPDWLENGFPGLPDTLDPYFFNAASEDQWLRGLDALEPGTPYEIWNMHPRQACLSGCLPCWDAHCFIRRRNGESLEAIAMRHTTAWFFPGHECVLLIFHGSADTAEDDASDIDVIMPALEISGQGRGMPHYDSVLRQRLPLRSGPLHALRDRDLVPEQALRRNLPDADGIMSRPGVVNQRRRADQLKRDMLERARAAGHDPADYGFDEAVAPALNSLDDLPVLARDARRQARRLTVSMLRKRREAEARLRDAFKGDHESRAGVEALIQGMDALPPGGPPRLDKSPGAAMLMELARESGAAGAGAHDMSPDRIRNMLDKGQADLAQLYQRGAHLQAPARTALGGRSARMRRRVALLMQGSRDLSGLDLTGIDLSGLDLSGARCRKAWMEGADLSGARLVGADLTDAVLARATLHETDFSDACLANANLGEVLSQGARFDRAVIRGAILDRSVFSQCLFDHAVLRDCIAADLDLIDCGFSHASLENVTFWQEARITRSHFAGASLRRVIWLECSLDAADYREATLVSCAWVKSLCLTPPGFVHSRLETCCVTETDMPAADFSHALLHESSLRGINLDGARFDHALIRNSDLSAASLRESSLRRVDANSTLFMGSDLTGADLRDSDFIDALLPKSDLRFADLGRANLFRADISQSLMDASTRSTGAYVKWAKTLPRVGGKD
jgi:uncharacterized protein YjbI with pentapeptide repeats